MSTFLVIDTTSRTLEMFTANISRSETGLVIRPALQLPGLGFFARGADWRSPKDSGGLPVLLIGDGYQALSSAGFVAVRGHKHLLTEPIVGWLGDHGLRVSRPRVARLLGPVRIVAEKTATNSNASTASAVEAGLALLEAADRRAVVIAEGQSDRAAVYRLLPAGPADRRMPRFEGDLEAEFRGEKFTPEAVMRSLFRAAFRAEQRSGVIGPVSCARRSLRRSAERIPVVAGLAERRLNAVDFVYGKTRLTTWEVAALAGCEGVWKEAWGEYPQIPLTLAQAAALAALDPESAEFTALAKADARELDLPIEEWERPLLDGESLSEPVATATDEEVRLAALPAWERGLYS